MKLPRFAIALRHRNFRLFVSGQAVSLVGTWLQTVAQGWLVYRLTGSSLDLGLVGLCSQVPTVVLAPVGGAVADRWSRRAILLLTQSASMLLALAFGVLTLTGRITLGRVFLLAAASGAINAIDQPVRLSFQAELVGGNRDLPNAIAFYATLVNLGRFLGPALAGVLVAAIGEGWCFVLNGTTYISVIFALLKMNLTPRPRDRGVSALRAIADGFFFVSRMRPLRGILLLLSALGLLGIPYSVLMPIFATRILGTGSRGLGILMAAVGVGALSGVGLLARRDRPHGLVRWLPVTAGGFGVSLLLFSLSRMFVVSTMLLMGVGFFMMLHIASSNTLMQVFSPPKLRGRVMSIYTMTNVGMQALGSFVIGGVANRLGAPTTVAAGAAICVCCGLLYARRLPAWEADLKSLDGGGEGKRGRAAEGS